MPAALVTNFSRARGRQMPVGRVLHRDPEPRQILTENSTSETHSIAVNQRPYCSFERGHRFECRGDEVDHDQQDDQPAEDARAPLPIGPCSSKPVGGAPQATARFSRDIV